MGKSTFINKIFKGCETNSGYEISTLGLNFYNIRGIENFAILDSPGDTEIPKSLKDYSSKGYQYSKILIYIMSEEKTLDTDSLKNNENLEKIIESLARYKIPLFILLTYSDKYCIK